MIILCVRPCSRTSSSAKGGLRLPPPRGRHQRMVFSAKFELDLALARPHPGRPPFEGYGGGGGVGRLLNVGEMVSGDDRSIFFLHFSC